MKLISILKEILLEGIKIQNNQVLSINFKENTPDDTFYLNKLNIIKRLSDIPTYFGIYPNPNTTEDIDNLFVQIKDGEIFSDEDLKKIILTTVPPNISVNYILCLASSKDLVKRMSRLLQQKYNINSQNVLNNMSKIEYFIDDIVNQEKYNEADPTTQKMIDTWISQLKKLYGTEKKIPIKKSPDPKTGHPGLQSGARGLLNPSFQLNDEIPENARILVIDDVLVGGSSLKEVYDALTGIGIPKNNIFGYCLGSKTGKGTQQTQKKIELKNKPLPDDIIEKFNKLLIKSTNLDVSNLQKKKIVNNNYIEIGGKKYFEFTAPNISKQDIFYSDRPIA